MKADVLYFPPIIGAVINGPWRGREGVITDWLNGGRVLVQFPGERRLRELRRDELRLFHWPPRTRKSPPAPPEWLDNDTGPDWPGAA